MADAYDVMQMAKKYGAAARNLEAWDKYMDDLQTFKKKQAKGSFFSGLASLGMGLAMPALIPAAGGSILDMGMKALGRGGITNALSNIADKAFGVPSIAPKFKGGDTSALGRAGRKKLERKAKSIEQDIQSSLDAGKRGKAFTTILQAIMPEIKAQGGIKEFGKKLFEGDIPFLPSKPELADVEALSQSLTEAGIKSTEGFEQSILDNLAKKYPGAGEEKWMPGSNLIDTKAMDSKAGDIKRAYTEAYGSPTDYSSYFEGINPEKSFSPLQITESDKSIASVMKVTPDSISSQYPHYPSHMEYTKAGGELDYDMWNQALEMIDYGGKAPKTIEELLLKLGQLQQPVTTRGGR